MTLPVSTVAPMPSPRLIDPGTYSPHVEVNIPGLDKPLRDLVCGSVFNNLAQKANVNRLRTFTYNLIAKGEHRSQDYIDLCEFAGNYTVNSYLKDKRKIESTGSSELPVNLTARIHEKVPEAITLWMTSLLPRFKELEYEIGSSLAHKTKKLYNTYINFQTEIKNMSLDQNTLMALSQLLAGQNGNQGNSTNAVLQALQQQNDPIIPVNINGQVLQMPRSQALALKAARESGQFGNGNMGGGSNILASLGIGGNNNSRGNTNGIGGILNSAMQGTDGMLGGITSDLSMNIPQQSAPVGSNALLRSWKQKRGEDIDEIEIVQEHSSANHSTVINLGAESGSVPSAFSINKPAAAEVNKTVELNKDMKGKNMITTKRLKIRGGNDKDHAGENITMFGFDIAKQTTPTYVKFGISNARFASATPTPTSETVEHPPENDGDDPTTQDVPVNSIISERLVLSNSNVGVISTVRENYTRQNVAFPETSDKFFFGHGCSIKAVYHTAEDIETIATGMFARMSTVSSFRQYLENMVQANVEALRAYEDYYSADVIRSVVTFAESFNTHITRMINDFLFYELDFNVTIESFVSDYSDLEILVAKRYGQAGTVALDKFTDEVISSLREGNSKIIKSYIKDIETETGLKMSAIVETNAVVCIPYTEGELGIICYTQPRYFDAKTNTALSILVRNMAQACEKLEFNALNFFIVTSDGSTLAVNPAAGQEDGNGFIIRKISDR